MIFDLDLTTINGAKGMRENDMLEKKRYFLKFYVLEEEPISLM
jgi:hypothetical protein